MQIEINECHDRSEWDSYVRSSIHGHPLQLWGWGDLKARSGWKVSRVFVRSGGQTLAAAQILFKKVPKVDKYLAYVPRGPVLNEDNIQMSELLASIAAFARSKNAISLKIEPAWMNVRAEEFKASSNRVLLKETLVIDLALSEEEILAGMRSKTRQYIRKGESSGVKVVRSQGPEYFKEVMTIYKETAKRASFMLHPDSYYSDLIGLMGDDSELFVALNGKEVVAFLWLVTTKKVSFELYGGQSAAGAELKANYYLKWWAVQNAKEHGVMEYDLNGRLNDGIDQFKAGFCEQPTSFVGTLDTVFNKPWYLAVEKGLPLAKKLNRLRSKK